MTPMRIRFSKTGNIKYISHLDLNRAMARGFSRAGIKLWYTEGYNPHPYLVFGPPLSVGYQGEREILDIRLISENSPEDIVKDLSLALPEGLLIKEVYQNGRPIKEISYASYHLYMEGGDPLFKAVIALQDKEKVTVLKKSKSKGYKETDITRYIRAFRLFPANDGYEAEIHLPSSQTENINPALIFSAVEAEAGIEFEYKAVTRLDFFDSNGERFY